MWTHLRTCKSRPWLGSITSTWTGNYLISSQTMRWNWKQFKASTFILIAHFSLIFNPSHSGSNSSTFGLALLSDYGEPSDKCNLFSYVSEQKKCAFSLQVSRIVFEVCTTTEHTQIQTLVFFPLISWNEHSQKELMGVYKEGIFCS